MAHEEVANGKSDDGPLVAAARAILDLAGSEPSRAIEAAAAFADRAARHQQALAVAHRARGLAHAKLGQMPEARRWLELALEVAQRAGDPATEAEAAMTYAGVLAWAGDADASDAAISFAVSTLTGVPKARALVQRASMRYRQGRFGDAIADQDTARPVLEAAGDSGWLANLLMDRGIIRGFAGHAAAARSDLARARRLYGSLGRSADAAWALENEGWLLAQIGDIPGALAVLDAAEDEFQRLDLSFAALWSDRCEALMAAHLTRDAKQFAGHAVQEAQRTGLLAGVAEARLRLAEAAMLDADVGQAREAADTAAEEFTAQQRPMWAAYARYVGIQARVASGGSGSGVGEVADVARTLEAGGFVTAGLHARILAAKIAASAGRIDVAEEHLAAAAQARRSGSVELRVQAWLAEALLRLASGRTRAADAALRAGLRAVDEAQAMFASPDARAHVAAHAAELADLGLGLAYDSGSTERIFRWQERTRAGALRHPSVRPPDDGELAGELAQLRAVEAELRRARLEGAAAGGLEVRAGRLRSSVRRRGLRRSGATSWAASRPPSIADVVSTLGTAALVELDEHRGALQAIVIRRTGTRRATGGDVVDIDGEMAALRFGLARLARRDGSKAAHDAARAATEAALSHLDELLVAPLALDTPHVVLVPPVRLHEVPWSLLPSLRGRAVTVAPSARLWLERRGRSARTRRGVVVAHGPGLPGAPEESRRVARIHRTVTRFTARTSKVEDVLAALDGARLAHFVAHGSFRADNPLFSSLRLADGELTVYDLERVDRLPPIVVLSACNSGLQAVRPGNETMGMVAALLGAGCRTVVASTGLVPDTSRTAQTMVDFHRRLAAGVSPSTALASAQGDALARAGAAAAPFVCFGAG